MVIKEEYIAKMHPKVLIELAEFICHIHRGRGLAQILSAIQTEYKLELNENIVMSMYYVVNYPTIPSYANHHSFIQNFKPIWDSRTLNS